MTEVAISIVLPVGKPEPALASVLESYVDALTRIGRDWELLLVPSLARGSTLSCERLGPLSDRVRVVAPSAGWGAAVATGLRASDGEVLCYTNWRRTPARTLSGMIDVALHNPNQVLRANRRTRDTRVRRLGSLLFNVECRFLLQIPVWDVNGTPKIFPRRFGELLALKRTDDLFDAEFALVCERAGYPVIEIPVDAEPLSVDPSNLGLAAALRMYLGLLRLRARSEL